MNRGLLMSRKKVFLLSCVVLLTVFFAPAAPARKIKLRVGYFPNITHAQALMGMAGGYFARELGPGVEVQPFLFNAGPSCMEALLAGRLDLTYVGPNPALNTYLRSNGRALRVLAGGCAGGSALVLRKGEEISSLRELSGKRLATPQLGNTQDIALRYFLREHGLKTREEGGEIQIHPVGNSNIILLFRRGEIDGAWTVEPWVSRLVVQEGGYIFLAEEELWPDGLYPTTYLVGAVTFLKKYPELAAKWVGVHLRLTRELTAEPERYIPEINKELAKVVGQPLPPEVLEPAIGRLRFTCLPMTEPFLAIAEKAHAVGFLPQIPPDLSSIFDLSFLEAAAGGDYSKIP